MSIKLQPNVDGSATILVGTTPALEISAAGVITTPETSGVMSLALTGIAPTFSSIPADVNEIDIAFLGASTNGTNNPSIRLGTSGGVQNSGYTTSMANVTTSSASPTTTITTGITLLSSNAGNILHGIIRLRRLDPSAHTWFADARLQGSGNSVFLLHTTSWITLASTLTQIEVTSTNKSDSWDAGNAYLTWRK